MLKLKQQIWLILFHEVLVLKRVIKIKQWYFVNQTVNRKLVIVSNFSSDELKNIWKYIIPPQDPIEITRMATTHRNLITI